MSDMLLRALGRTGLSVSEVGLGCEHLQGKDCETVREVIGAAMDSGVNIMDVFMSEPTVRDFIGLALEGRRERMIVQGHIGAAWLDGQYTRTRDPKTCEMFFLDLLARLRTDYVDLGMLHFVDETDDLERLLNGPVYAYARHMRKQGAIRAIGLSTHNPEVVTRAAESGAVGMLMFSVNPAYDMLRGDTNIDALFEPASFKETFGTHPDRARAYATCEARGVGITVMKGFGAGVLLDGKISPFGQALTPEQLIHYALTRPAVSSVLVGCRTGEEVRAAVAYEQASEQARDYAVPLASTRAYSMSGQCMYCNHCHPCPERIDVAMVNKYLDMAQSDAPESVRDHYLRMEKRGGDCVSCGACEKRCPFGVKVRERMARAKEVFGA